MQQHMRTTFPSSAREVGDGHGTSGTSAVSGRPSMHRTRRPVEDDTQLGKAASHPMRNSDRAMHLAVERTIGSTARTAPRRRVEPGLQRCGDQFSVPHERGYERNFIHCHLSRPSHLIRRDFHQLIIEPFLSRLSSNKETAGAKLIIIYAVVWPPPLRTSEAAA